MSGGGGRCAEPRSAPPAPPPVHPPMSAMHEPCEPDPLAIFQPPVRAWFAHALGSPTPAQVLGWPPIAAGRSTLLLAPTGSGKTLAAFLAAIDRLMFAPAPARERRCRVLYVSPMKALAVDVEKNLRAPIAGIRTAAGSAGAPHHVPTIGVRTGDTPAPERARMLRDPPDVLITTPESLYLLLTSRAQGILASVEVVIVDEIHAVAGAKRGAHLFLSLERLEAVRDAGTPLQRIGLSATQRPLEEIARLLGGGTLPAGPDGPWVPRPVEIADAGSTKALEVVVEPGGGAGAGGGAQEAGGTGGAWGTGGEEERGGREAQGGHGARRRKPSPRTPPGRPAAPERPSRGPSGRGSTPGWWNSCEPTVPRSSS